MYTAADLAFDAASHTSRLPDGQQVPHVTEILSAVGVATDFGELAQRSGRMATMLGLARDRGTAVHADCHAFDDQDLDWTQVDPRVLPYVEAWATFREHKGAQPVAHGRERQVFEPVRCYTGILDGVFALPDGANVLIDVKTGDPADSGARWQTAAYQGPWNIERWEDAFVSRRWAVWLKPGLRVPYRITDYTALSDASSHYDEFLSMLCVYRLQACRRAR